MRKLILTISLLISSLFSCDILEGRIAVKGNEPFTFLSIETSKGLYKILEDSPIYDEIYKGYQGQSIKLEGEITKEIQEPMEGEFLAKKKIR